jgi:O-antigen ligase
MAATFACFLLVFLLCSPKSLKRYLPYAIGTFIGAILVYSLAVLNLLPGSNLLLSPITMVTGKDLTFSGRTPIWNILNQHIALSPIYGSGYAGYWNLLPESPSMEMLRELYFYPSEGHNGYLDVINDLGFLGAVCLFGYVIAFLREGLFVFKTMRSQGALYLALLFEQLIGNLSESRWFNAGLFDFIILTTATVIMARTAMELRANDKQYVIQQSVPARRF